MTSIIMYFFLFFVFLEVNPVEYKNNTLDTLKSMDSK